MTRDEVIKLYEKEREYQTEIFGEYKNNPSDFETFTWERYLDFIISFLEFLNPDIVVERFTGEAPPRFLERTVWGKKRTDQIVGLIEERLEELDTWQGRLYKK